MINWFSKAQVVALIGLNFPPQKKFVKELKIRLKPNPAGTFSSIERGYSRKDFIRLCGRAGYEIVLHKNKTMFVPKKRIFSAKNEVKRRWYSKDDVIKRIGLNYSRQRNLVDRFDIERITNPSTSFTSGQKGYMKADFYELCNKAGYEVVTKDNRTMFVPVKRVLDGELV